MTKTYVTSKYSIEVMEYEVVNVTKHRIRYMVPNWRGNGFSETIANKESEYFQHHESMADAIQFLIERESDRAEWHRKKMMEHEQNASILIGRTA